MSDYQGIGQAFTRLYYSTLDADRSKLGGLYRETSLLTFEGHEFMGVASIVGKYASLPFTKVVHSVVTCDAQPVMNAQPQGLLVFVNGNMVVDDGEHPMKFAQVFYLLPDPAQPGQYWVSADIFRLNLG